MFLNTDIRRVGLMETDCQNQVEFEDRTLTLTRMEPVSWLRWIVGEVEDKAVFLSRINCDFIDKDVTDYFTLWCRESQSGNAVVETRTGKKRALVLFENIIGKLTVYRIRRFSHR